MNSAKNLLANKASALILATACFLVCENAALAQNVQHLSFTQPGGMPGMPVMAGIEKTSNGVTVTWDGPSGYYQLVRKSGLLDVPWQPVGGPSLSRKATITGIYSNAFFAVSGPAPQYAGSQACIECHENIHTTEMDTRHARALDTLKQAHQDKNPSCLPCHTVGYGLPSGFVSEAATPQLAGVQCENCHGPAANHAANEFDMTVRPRVEIAATVCGGCHTDSHHPTFDEWETSGHAVVVEDMNPTNRIESCGRCHSGSSRLAQLDGLSGAALTNAVQGDANIGVVCITCHDPHANHVWTNTLSGVITNTFDGYVITNSELGRIYTNQLRNPVSSTNYYSLTTATNLIAGYNPNINICAQCHNARGAGWKDSSRSPHHSPQYNMLLGSVGELATGTSSYQPATHALMEKQCAACHMQQEELGAGSPEGPAMTGHTFEMNSYNVCTQCHGSNTNNIASFVRQIQSIVLTSQDFSVWQVKAQLDQWAIARAPAAIQKYGALAWEYQTAGELSSPDGSLRGPVSNTTDATKDEQKYIPDNIKKARFNLYLVYYDGSAGVHNGPYAIALLFQARDWVRQELDQ